MGVGNCMRIPRSDLKCGCATHLKVLCARGAISLQTESKIVHFIIITISGRHLPGAIGRARLWNAVDVCVCVRPSHPAQPGLKQNFLLSAINLASLAYTTSSHRNVFIV